MKKWRNEKISDKHTSVNASSMTLKGCTLNGPKHKTNSMVSARKNLTARGEWIDDPGR